MNKADKAIVALLFALLLAWGFYQRMFAPPATPRQAAATAATNAPSAAVAASTNVEPAVLRAVPPPATGVVAAAAAPAAPSPATPAPVPAAHAAPEVITPLSNAVVAVSVSSWGGGIKAARLAEYRATVRRDSGPLVLDFADQPALSLVGLAGMTAGDDFAVVAASATQVVLTAASPEGLQLTRTLRLDGDYRMKVVDAFANRGTAALTLPTHGINVGPMRLDPAQSLSQGITYLGIDTLPDAAGRDVTYWGKSVLPGLFGVKSSGFGCSKASALGAPATASQRVGSGVAWVAAKDKFFVQILAAREGAADCDLQVGRDTTKPSLVIDRVAAALYFSPRVLQPGETATLEFGYYVGPKKQDLLKSLPNRQAEVMQFGWWAWFRWVCVVLLATLNAIHKVLPNYGVAIILLTVLVRVLFWPLTHKSTESMKKMQKLQPLINELKAKYKDQPQKIQQAQMALFREHGVNPMASCLPMLVQIPIFIALFVVLRSAVELRFAGFLWISDLSEPENLLAGVLPIPLNIWPLLMTATMFWQQKLTPATGDPQQQKMMLIMMPVMMLFFLYSMASALVLYWTVSNCIAIGQLLWQRRGVAGAPPAPVPAK